MVFCLFYWKIYFFLKVLYNLLRMYAYYDPIISYCQGMNFVMGFLFHFIQDEELTFKCFAVLLEKMLRCVLTQDLQRVKLLFYQLDRLVSKFLPNLAEHFHVFFHHKNSFFFKYFFFFNNFNFFIWRSKKLIPVFMHPHGSWHYSPTLSNSRITLTPCCKFLTWS